MKPQDEKRLDELLNKDGLTDDEQAELEILEDMVKAPGSTPASS